MRLKWIALALGNDVVMKDPFSLSAEREAPSQYAVLRYFIKPYRWLFGGIFVATLVTSILEGINVAAFFPVFHSLLERGGGAKQGGILGAIASVTGILPFQDPIVSAAVLLIGITLLKSGMSLLRENVVAYASGTVHHDVKNRLMETYASSSYQFFLDNKQGKLIYDALIAPVRVGILMQRVPQLGADLFKIMTIGVLLLSTIPLATSALAVVGLGYAWITRYLSKRISYNTGKGRAIASTEQASIANEFLSGIRQITTFCTKRHWLQRFEQHSRAYRDLSIRDAVWQVVPRSLMEPVAVFLMLGFIVMSRLSSPRAFTEELPVMGVFLIALVQLLPALNNLGRGRMDVLSSMADCELIYHALTEPRPRRKDGSQVFESLREAIVFERVSFAYSDRQSLLQRFDVTFEKGKVTAIVGPSGVGKTTIVNLVLGFFEPTEGRIVIDDVPLQEYRLQTWLKHVGVVSQDPFIYHATVADNITFGRTGYSRQLIQRAAEIANAHGFISELSQTYETIVGDRGMKLSGGEQQRIAIARAVLDDPDVLIFDEATSSLDTLSERLVQEAIEQISRDRTVIIIAHRLSTVRHADKIVVLDQGRIIEEGNHHELLAERGRYFQLVTSSAEREFI